MTREPPSARALLAAYKACARPSEAAEAQIWAALAAAERAAEARPPRPAVGRAPWLALAACLVLLAAWLLDLPRFFASGHVLKDMNQQAEHDLPAPDVRPATARGGAPPGPEVQPVLVPAPPPPTPERRRPDRHAPDPARSGQDGARAPAEPGDEPGDRVLAEMALLQQARAALRGGRPDAALELLARHAVEFAAGSMTEERQALRVLALCAAGDGAGGSAARAEFLAAHPRSTYAPRVADACPEGHVSSDTQTIP